MNFTKAFSNKLAKTTGAEFGMRGNDPTETNIPCTTCGRNMQIRTGATGVFFRLLRLRTAAQRALQTTMNLAPGEEAINTEDEEVELAQLRAKKRCKLCNATMDSYLLDETRKLHICGNNP